MSESEETPTTAPVASGGLFDDLLEIFTAPATVFNRSRERSAWGYVLVLALVTLVLVVATKNIVGPWMDAQSDVALKMAAAKGKPIPDAAAAKMRGFSTWSLVIGAPVATLFGPFISAIFLFIGAKVVKARVAYRQATVIMALASVPRLLAWLVMAGLALVLPAADARSMADLSLGVARFFDPVTTPPALQTLVANLELFRIWEIVLVGIGASVVGRVSRGAGLAAALIGVACMAILQLIPAALF